MGATVWRGADVGASSRSPSRSTAALTAPLWRKAVSRAPALSTVVTAARMARAIRGGEAAPAVVITPTIARAMATDWVSRIQPPAEARPWAARSSAAPRSANCSTAQGLMP
ncbi:hypothetical protein D3C85_1255900 [compost metagenome]